MNINDPNLLNVYMYGSRVYGTSTPKSDHDYICIVKDTNIVIPDINIRYLTLEQFQTCIDNHDIPILECLFLNKEFILKETILFHFDLNLNKLRIAVSTIANGAWVKGKKKLVVLADYNKDIALKSIFHSLRIRDYGIQIAQYGKICNYSTMNYILRELRELGTKYCYAKLWDEIESKYKDLYNNLSSEFVNLCPKEFTKNDLKKQKLKELLNSKQIKDDTLIESIYDIFVKEKDKFKNQDKKIRQLKNINRENVLNDLEIYFNNTNIVQEDINNWCNGYYHTGLKTIPQLKESYILEFISTVFRQLDLDVDYINYLKIIRYCLLMSKVIGRPLGYWLESFQLNQIINLNSILELDNIK